MLAAKNRDLIYSNGIQSIVSVLSECTTGTNYPNITYYRINIDDSYTANITPHIPGVIGFIHAERQRGKTVLVHCAAGISRSSSVVCAYLMAKYLETYEQAIAKVKSKRPMAEPNQGFVHQLKSMDIDLLHACLHEESQVAIHQDN